MSQVAVYNRQRSVPLDIAWLRRFAADALPEAAGYSGGGALLLRRLPEVEVALVSDRIISGVHKRFMALPEPTDVLTFSHGEIVISACTARDRASEFGHAIELEIALYIVHGLLHLNGFDDAAPSDAARMCAVQNRVWKRCLKRISTASPPQ